MVLKDTGLRNEKFFVENNFSPNFETLNLLTCTKSFWLGISQSLHEISYQVGGGIGHILQVVGVKILNIK